MLERPLSHYWTSPLNAIVILKFTKKFVILYEQIIQP